MDKNDKQHLRKIQGKIDLAIEKHCMIENNDTVLVGLSGGKDSFTLLDVLSNRRKYYKTNFKLIATHINISNIPYSVDLNYIENFCKERDVEFIYQEKKIDIDKDKLKTNPCFICSWNRRKLLFNLTKELKCNKLALGHHKDDAVETFLLNMLYHSSISSLPAKLKMFEGRVHLIRPMIYLSKDEINRYAELKLFPEQKLTCSYDHITKRNEMAMLLRGMEILNPNVKNNIFNSMSNIFDEYLPK